MDILSYFQSLSPVEKQKVLSNLDKLPVRERTELIKLLEEYESRQKRKAMQGGLQEFAGAVANGFKVGAHHRHIFSLLEKAANTPNQRIIINIAPRHAIMLGMKIPTTNGFKPIETIAVGDYVFGPDGLPTQVIGKSEVFKSRDIYRVTTDDGAYIDVDGEHLWTVRLHRKHNKYLDYTTEQLWRRQNGEVLRTKRGGGIEFIAGKVSTDIRLPRLPDIAPVEYPEQSLVIDPYVLGVWLGDGSTNQAIITSHPDDSIYLRAEFERAGYPTTDQADPYTFGVSNLRVQLKQLGLLGNKKYIPEQYMTSSVEQRWAILQGLMDTDGNVSKKGQCFFTQSDEKFIRQVQQLVHSLGIKCSLSAWNPSIGEKKYKTAWRITFYASGVCRLPRKEERTLKTPRAFGRYISIEKLNKQADTQCITVARPDGLFLAGEGYICTHNSKSETCSWLFPAWFLGHHPDRKVIMATHTADLSTSFGRRVRDLVNSDAYRDIFPGTVLNPDAKAAGQWNTSKGGSYYAVGVGGALAGRGGDLIIIDDPHSEQEAKTGNPEVFLSAWEWFQSGPLQRTQPGASIVVLMTRWSMLDLTGQLINHMTKNPDADQWEVVEFPAILDENTDKERPLWPEFWSIEELRKKRAGLDVRYWSAQYMQNPTAEGAQLIKAEWWQHWEDEDPPDCEYTIMSLDAAQEATNRADYNALTLWGVFYDEDPNTGNERANIILLNAWKRRMEFPELKRTVLEEYQTWEPDTFIVEKKSNGAALYQELRSMGIPVSEFTPSKGNDKVSRVNAVTDLFSSGIVWAPTDRRWAQEVITECAEFPVGANDDLVDSTTQALIRFRRGGFIRLPSDEPEEERDFRRTGRRYYAL